MSSVFQVIIGGFRDCQTAMEAVKVKQRHQDLEVQGQMRIATKDRAACVNLKSSRKWNIMMKTQDSLVSGSTPKRSNIKQQQQQQPLVKYSLQNHKYTVMR